MTTLVFPANNDSPTTASVRWLSREELDAAAAREILATQVVLDIGCGLRPQTFFRPAIHICCEPHGEYAQHLRRAFRNEPGMFVAQSTARDLLPLLSDRSVDSVFMLDVIEHLTRDDGLELIAQSERIARRQIVLFTPLGFMPQGYDDGEVDGWGLNGARWQRHLSGWTPDDLPPGWTSLACKDYHACNGKGEEISESFGAFWAIKTFPTPPIHEPRALLVSDSFPPEATPSARALGAALTSYPPEALTLASTRHFSPYDVVRSHGRVPTDAASTAAIEAARVRLNQALEDVDLPRFVRRVALYLRARPCADQLVQQATTIGAKAIVATLDGRIELAAALSAAKRLRLPLVVVVDDQYEHQPRRGLLRSRRERAVNRADLVWAPGNAPAAAALARPGQRHSGSESLASVLASVIANHADNHAPEN